MIGTGKKTFQNMGLRMKDHRSNLVTNFVNKSIPPPDRFNIDEDQWAEFVRQKDTPEFKV